MLTITEKLHLWAEYKHLERQQDAGNGSPANEDRMAEIVRLAGPIPPQNVPKMHYAVVVTSVDGVRSRREFGRMSDAWDYHQHAIENGGNATFVHL